MHYKVALIVVDDISISRKFYEEILNQKISLDFGDNVTFDGGFSLQTISSWMSFTNIEKNDIISKPNNFELYFEEESFDDFIEKLKGFEIQYLHNVVEYPWGQRVIRFYDPDMHIIEVGESMKTVVKKFFSLGLSVEQIVEKTQHPIEFVKDCL